MREKRTVQGSIFEAYAEHEIGRELKAMSDWLDQHLDLLDWVAADVKQRNVEKTGRKGLTIESVLRCAILKQYRQLSYEDLGRRNLGQDYPNSFSGRMLRIRQGQGVALARSCTGDLTPPLLARPVPPSTTSTHRIRSQAGRPRESSQRHRNLDRMR